MRLANSLCAFLFCSLTTGLAMAEEMVGFRQPSLADGPVMIWYPTEQTAPISKVAENKVFFGVEVVADAPVSSGNHPLVILSHGYSGLWRNQAWLADYLARAGYVVAAFDHAGTSYSNMDPSWANKLARRPHQISEILTALLANETVGGRIDHSRISVIGHSLGGSSALFLAGGIFEPARLIEACGDDTDKLLCKLYRAGGLSKDMEAVSAHDQRISSIVLLDMEGVRAFTPESLGAINIPVLALVSGVEDPALPLHWEGRQQAALLPTSISRYSEIVGATHFSFMSLCKPGAIEMLEEEAFVCKGETAPREQLHQQIAQTVITFLNSGRQMVSALQAP